MQEQDKLKQEQLDKLNKLKADYEAVFSSPAGQRVVKDILTSGYKEKSTYTGDINALLINEGKRMMALHIEFMSKPQPQPKKKKEGAKK